MCSRNEFVQVLRVMWGKTLVMQVTSTGTPWRCCGFSSHHGHRASMARSAGVPGHESHVTTKRRSVIWAIALWLQKVHVVIRNTLLLKNADYHMSLQQVIITNHRSPWQIQQFKRLNIPRIIKMWHRNTKWANANRKMVSTDLHDKGLPQSFNL